MAERNPKDKNSQHFKEIQFLQASDVWSVIEMTTPTRKVLEEPASTEVREAPGLAANQMQTNRADTMGKKENNPSRLL